MNAMCVECYEQWQAISADYYKTQPVVACVVWEGESRCLAHYNLARWGNDQGRPVLDPSQFEGKEETRGAVDLFEVSPNATLGLTPVEGTKVVLDTEGPAVSFALPDGARIAHDPDPNGGALTYATTWRVIRDLDGSCWTFLLPDEKESYQRLMHSFGLKHHTVTTQDFATHELAMNFAQGRTESNPQTRLIDAMHERTNRCLGGNHLDCAMVEQRHREGNHSECLPVEDGATEHDGVNLLNTSHEFDPATVAIFPQGPFTQPTEDGGTEAAHNPLAENCRQRKDSAFMHGTMCVPCFKDDLRGDSLASSFPTSEERHESQVAYIGPLCDERATFGPDGANITQAAKDAMSQAFSCDLPTEHDGDHQAHDADGNLLCWWEQKPTCQCRDSNREGPIKPPGRDQHDPTGLHYSYCPLYDAPVDSERCEADTAIDGKHDWQPLHGGRVFESLKDSSDAVMYEGCTACAQERSVPMSKAYDSLKGIQT